MLFDLLTLIYYCWMHLFVMCLLNVYVIVLCKARLSLYCLNLRVFTMHMTIIFLNLESWIILVLLICLVFCYNFVYWLYFLILRLLICILFFWQYTALLILPRISYFNLFWLLRRCSLLYLLYFIYFFFSTITGTWVQYFVLFHVSTWLE